MRILVIEDEKKVAAFIKKGFEEELYQVDVAFNGKEGLELTFANEYDLIISDIMMPKMMDWNTLEKRGKAVLQPRYFF